MKKQGSYIGRGGLLGKEFLDKCDNKCEDTCANIRPNICEKVMIQLQV